MAVQLTLPNLGENVPEGTVLKLLVAQGARVAKDQPLLEVETEKAAVEVPAEREGVLVRFSVKPGDKVKVGQVIAELETEAAAVPSRPETPAPAAGPTAAPGPTAGVDLVLPSLGENVPGGTVIKVLVKAGDVLKKDDPVAEVETEKAAVDIPAGLEGEVLEVMIKVGDEVKVGQTLLRVAAGGAAPAAAPKPFIQTEKKVETPKVQAATAVVESIAPAPTGTVGPASPSVRVFAREIGVDLSTVVPTGPGGRVTKDDVMRASRQRAVPPQSGGTVGAPGARAGHDPLPDLAKWGPVSREKISTVRRVTAEHMERSYVPRVSQFDKTDITELENLRKQFSKVAGKGTKLTMTAIAVKVLASALRKFPQFNVSLDWAAQELVKKDYVHIGIAVDTPQGLLVPVIRDADKKGVLEIAEDVAALAKKARERKISPDDLKGGCMTVTNLGGIGGTNFTPVVNWPEPAILGMSRGQIEPVYQFEGFQPRLMLPLVLTYDHRVIDGADAARFLRWICQAMQSPMLMDIDKENT